MTTQNHADIVAALQSRWPENRIGPSLARISALCDLLGDPHKAMPVIQITGTNGKGSTAIMIDALLRSAGLRVGRFSSPHLIDVTERICIDGEPMAADDFDALVTECMPYIEMVDAQQIDGISMTFFEVITGLAYAAFAAAPVDVAVIEVGLGGSWDATSVGTPDVAVICPIDIDHAHILGDTAEEIAAEKAGIIKAGSTAVVAEQTPEVATVIARRCASVGAKLIAEGEDFSLVDRRLAVGGQVIRLSSASGSVGDLVLPVFGEHMAHNAALALAAVEALLGGRALAAEVIMDGFADVKAPARLEVMRRTPPMVLDTCHNPHGARATIAAVKESFDFDPLIGVVAAMGDKDVDGIMRIFAQEMSAIVCTTVASTNRALSPSDLAEIARDHFAEEQVHLGETMAEAIDRAAALADEAGVGAGILIAGSVIAAGEARALFNIRVEEEDQ